MNGESTFLRMHETLLILAGLLLLVGVWMIARGGVFDVWTAGKILYGAGVLLFLTKT